MWQKFLTKDQENHVPVNVTKTRENFHLFNVASIADILGFILIVIVISFNYLITITIL